MRNVEIKARIRNLAKLLEKASSLTGQPSETIRQHDTFYLAQNGRLKLRRFEDGSAELIQYDRPDVSGPKLSNYVKARIHPENVDDLHRVLNKALGSTGIVKKKRELFLYQQTRIHVDSVEGLGDFMELEVTLRPEETEKHGEAIAHNLMKALGVAEDDLVSGAYTDLLK